MEIGYPINKEVIEYENKYAVKKSEDKLQQKIDTINTTHKPVSKSTK